MSSPMTKTALIAALVEKTFLSKQDVSKVLDGLTEIATEQVSAGNSFVVPGIAKIAIKDRPDRQVRNPATGETSTKAADRTVKSMPTKAMKDAANNSAA